MLLSTRDEGGDDERARSASSESSATQPAGRIAYLSGPVLSASVYVVDAAGGEPEMVLDTGAETLRPDWSPDGRALAFTRTVRRNQDVYVIARDAAAAPRRLTRTGAPDQEAAWSPDGTRIAFSSRRDGNWELYTIAPDGTAQRRVTRTRAPEGAPAWSPDGRTVAFQRVTAARADLWLAAADGSGARRVTARSGNEVDVAWSPDGTQLAFASDRGGRWRIHALVLAEGRRTELVSAGPARYPDWQPLRR